MRNDFISFSLKNGMMTYEQLVDELQVRSADELVDLAELARNYARERRREEIRKNIEEGRKEYLEGKLKPATDNIDELMARLNDIQ